MHALVLAAIITVVAPAFGTVADVRVQVDDGVAEGDIVLAFDTEQVDRRVDAANAELGAAQEASALAARKLDAFTRIDGSIASGNIDATTLTTEDALKVALAELDRQRQLHEVGEPEQDVSEAAEAVLAAQAGVDEVRWRAAHPKGGPARGAQLRNEVAAATRRNERATAAVERANAELAAAHVASTAAGTVKAVLVSAGQRVRKGQPLVRIDTGE